MEIRFDHTRCQGHAQCAAQGPDVYPLDEVGHCALPAVTTVAPEVEEQARAGALACPEQTLSVQL